MKLSLIAYYERRARNPSLEVAGKFAAFFDVPWIPVFLLVLFIIYMPKGVVGTLAERFRRKAGS